MVSLKMHGPFGLSSNIIDKQITTTSPGNYALGYTDGDGTFIVQYVGRSDTDVKTRIKDWEGRYRKFKYSLASSAKAAFEKECHNYHDFGGSQKLNNKAHPDRPNGTNWKCPVCKIFDS